MSLFEKNTFKKNENVEKVHKEGKKDINTFDIKVENLKDKMTNIVENFLTKRGIDNKVNKTLLAKDI